MLASCKAYLHSGKVPHHNLGLAIQEFVRSSSNASASSSNARTDHLCTLTPAHIGSSTGSSTSQQPPRPTWHSQPPSYKGVLVDAAGTLMSPSEPAAAVYLRYAQKHGCLLSAEEVLWRFRRAYNLPWTASTIRYVGDGRPFWSFIVKEATGVDSPEVFEEIYKYYGTAEAWTVPPDAAAALTRLRQAGIKLAVVSNFDTRLRPLLAELGIDHLFDTIVVSAEVGAEKPNPVIFEAALSGLQLRPDEVVHVGDDRRNDVWGARDAGVTAWLWGVDVTSFSEVEDRVLYGHEAQEYYEELHLSA